MQEVLSRLFDDGMDILVRQKENNAVHERRRRGLERILRPFGEKIAQSNMRDT